MPSHALKHEPLDAYNLALTENLHPSGWVNPTPADRYNMVVIGAGTAGLVTAAGAAILGAKVALVERDLMGGDCLNFGCVPSKALIRSARAAAAVRDAERFGVEVPQGVRVNFPAVMERMRKLRAELSPTDSANRFRGLGVDVFIGDGRFVAPDCRRGGRQAAQIQESRDHDRGARGVATDSGSCRRRLPDQRDGFLADRIAAANRGDWRGADRMRAGADLRALRRAGHAARSRAANPDSRGSRRRRTGRARDRPRRRGNRHGLQNFRRREARQRKNNRDRARRRPPRDCLPTRF